MKTYREIWEKGGLFIMEDHTRTIYKKVLDAMQEAEELGGPKNEEYMYLMTQIAHTALIRMLAVERKPTRLSIQQFRETGKNVVFKDCFELAGCDIDCFMGRVYANNCWIGLLDSGKWWLQICNEEYADPDLAVLEERLYNDWYCHET